MIAAIVIESDVAMWAVGLFIVPAVAAWWRQDRRMTAMAAKVANVDNAVNHGRMERIEATVNATEIKVWTLSEHVSDLRGGTKEASRHMFAIGVDGAKNGETLDAHADRLAALEKRMARQDERIGRLEIAGSSSR